MPRSLLALAVGVFALAVSVTAPAADPKKAGPQTFEGKLVCAKCTLGDESKGCRHALKTTADGKEVVLYVDDKGGREKYHKKVCPEGAEIPAKVTGTLGEKEGKKWITGAKVELK